MQLKLLVFIYNELKIFVFESDIALCVCIFIIHTYTHSYVYIHTHTQSYQTKNQNRNNLDLMVINILEGKVLRVYSCSNSDRNTQMLNIHSSSLPRSDRLIIINRHYDGQQ